MKLRKFGWFLLFSCFLMLISCASTEPVIKGQQGQEEVYQPIVFPPYSGPKTVLAVLPMGLSDRAAKRYPHLLDSSVGLGVHNSLTDALYRTRRFRFVEEKESVIKEAFKKQWLSASGAVDQSSAIKMGRLLGAKKVIYGEVYDYSEGKVETLAGFQKVVRPQIRVGVQIRLVDLETLEYIPASGLKYGTDWGDASRKSIEAAVLAIVSDL